MNRNNTEIPALLCLFQLVLPIISRPAGQDRTHTSHREAARFLPWRQVKVGAILRAESFTDVAGLEIRPYYMFLILVVRHPDCGAADKSTDVAVGWAPPARMERVTCASHDHDL